LLGERIEVRVGGGIRALSTAAPDSGVGREQDEGVHVTDELVEVPGTDDLGGEDLLDLLRCHVVQ
jgi:hypothetical protein